MTEKGHWTAKDVPDMMGKIAIVTGANSGIGYETARVLAARGAQVTLACRNLEKAKAAQGQITREHPQAQVELTHLDLANLASVRRFAGDFSARHDPLDLLVNNAGVMAIPERWTTDDGFEMQFGTNHLGHFALTGLLMDAIKRAPGARVVTVSSSAHARGRIDFDDLNAEKSYSRLAAYSQSKLANLLFTYELQRRFESAGVEAIAAAAHPGWTATNLQAHILFFRVLNPLVAQKIDMGALPTLRAATAPDVQGGDYYGPGGFMGMRGAPVKVQSHERSHDQAVAGRLWQVSEEMTDTHYL